MAPIRFRVRTIMIVIAALAILMAMIPTLIFVADICDVSVGIDGSNVTIAIESLPASAFDPTSSQFMRSRHTYGQAPIRNVAALAAVFIVALGLAVYFRSSRQRWGKPSTEPKRPIGRSEPHRSEE
jgi:hypothetical protein